MGKRMRKWGAAGIPPAGVVFLAALAFAAAVGCSSDAANPGGTATLPAEPHAQPTQRPTDDPLQAAAAEATAIVQEAQATALVLQAQAEATALVGKAASAGQQETVATAPPSPDQEAPAAAPSPTPIPQSAPTPTRVTVEIIGVGFAGEGGYIHVQFRAPVATARRWQQGLISVTDEKTGTVYAQIPVMPKIGALIGKPIREGQPGYVMLVNGPIPIQPGALVTVVLGNYAEEHLVVGQ